MSRLAITILAAGQSTRFRSRRSKLLHPLAGRPMVAYPLRLAQALEPHTIVAILGHLAEEVLPLLEPGVRHVLQEPQLGTGHALQQAQPILEEACDQLLVLYGDVPLLREQTLRHMVQQHHRSAATLTVLTGHAVDPTGYGRIVRDGAGQVRAIVEELDASPEERRITEINSGILLFEAAWLWAHLPQIPRSAKGEYYLTDLVGRAVASGERVSAHLAADGDEILGVNDRVQLATAQSILRQRVNHQLMLSGVTIVDPTNTYIDDTVTIGQDSVIHPHCHLQGETQVGEDCAIGPNAILVDTVVGDRCQILASVLEQAELDDEVDVGPFSHMRRGARLGRGVHIGNFGEVKESTLGPGVKMGHFSYIGDAEIGAETNIGAGTITCNYDGRRKHRTVIGRRTFIGSDTMLVAPVEVGDDAVTGAGSVVTRNVPPGHMAYGVPAKVKGEAKDGRR